MAEKFAQTDFAKLNAAAALSFYMIMSFAKTGANTATLERIAQVHSRQGRDIKPALYDLWLECLLTTVQEFDRRFTEETEHAWRAVMGCGIEFLKSHYH